MAEEHQMSHVTDVVFITPKYLSKARERFEELYRKHYTRYGAGLQCPPPMEDNGTKVTGVVVFFMGVNYADWEWMEAIRNEPWPKGTVLYMDGDGHEETEIKTW
jgi:hypothetical protein